MALNTVNLNNIQFHRAKGDALSLPRLLVIVFLCGFSIIAFSDVDIKQNQLSIPILLNQGFVTGEKKEELKNKFSACDEFLDVNWINKEQGVGYVKHDLYKNEKLVGHMDSLVFMRTKQNQHYRPYDRIELYTLRRQGKFEQLMNALKSGRVTAYPETTGLNVFSDGFNSFLSQNNLGMTYTGNKAVVCIPYQDYSKAWLVESKNVKNALNENEFEKLYQQMVDKYPRYKKESLKKLFVLDLNQDGIQDFFTADGYTYLSQNGKYNFLTRLAKRTSKKGNYWSFGLKGKSSLCEVLTRSRYFVTTDGNEFFQNNQCSFKRIAD